jgi:uncharacterized membrane protein YebE (DUF533 family)
MKANPSVATFRSRLDVDETSRKPRAGRNCFIRFRSVIAPLSPASYPPPAPVRFSSASTAASLVPALGSFPARAHKHMTADGGSAMDAKRLLGALLGGVLTPQRAPRRTTRTAAKPTAKSTAKRAAAQRSAKPTPLIDVRIGGSRRTASSLAALARLAAEALAQTTASRAPASRAPSPPGGPVPVPYPASGRPGPWGAAKPAAPPPAEPVGAEDREALLIIRAMIAAARADGVIDTEERAAIAGQLDQAGLDDEARELVLKEFAAPASLDTLAAEITDPVLAAQVYAACMIAVGAATEPERAWLAELARRTGLAAETIAAIERRLAAG